MTVYITFPAKLWNVENVTLCTNSEEEDISVDTKEDSNFIRFQDAFVKRLKKNHVVRECNLCSIIRLREHVACGRYLKWLECFRYLN